MRCIISDFETRIIIKIAAIALAVSGEFTSLPATAQMTPSGLAKMTAAFDSWVTSNGVANASMVVTQGSAVVATVGRGGWTVDTVAPIASTSKAITAICIMALVDENKIAFSDTVQKLLPAFTDSIDALHRPNAALITVEHLLRHTSGFAVDPVQGSTFATGAAAANPDVWFAGQAFNQALAATPGTIYNYNDTNYALLGMIINTVTDETYERYCKKTVLTPRGANGATLATGTLSALGAFGGWTISAREYASFYTSAFDPGSLSAAARGFMDRVFELDCVCGYGLGVLVQPILRFVNYLTPRASTLMFHQTPRGPLMVPIELPQDMFVVPIQKPDDRRYDLYHTGNFQYSGVAQQFSSIAAYWTNGVAVIVICDSAAGGGSLDALEGALRAEAFDAGP
jgi:CubicO group peptidase (beta-lactamase class C family)